MSSTKPAGSGSDPIEIVRTRRFPVVGDSMIEAAICDGDIVTVRKADSADHGDVVAAMLDGEATVKRLRRENGRVWLMPHNAAHQPIPGDDAVILGKVVAVLWPFRRRSAPCWWSYPSNDATAPRARRPVLHLGYRAPGGEAVRRGLACRVSGEITTQDGARFILGLDHEGDLYVHAGKNAEPTCLLEYFGTCSSLGLEEVTRRVVAVILDIT